MSTLGYEYVKEYNFSGVYVNNYDKSKNDDSLTKLQKAMGFDEQDLKANRDGYLSKRQSRRILSYVVANVLFFGACALTSMGSYFIFDSPMYGLVGNMHPFLPFFTIIFIGFALMSPWKHLPDFFSKHPQVRVISGQLRVSTRMAQHRSELLPPRTHSLYVLFFDPAGGFTQSESFAITEATYNALANTSDDLYTIYYLPHAMILIAIERDHFNLKDPETTYLEYHAKPSH